MKKQTWHGLIFIIITKDFLLLLSKRAKLHKQYPEDTVVQRYTCLFYCLHSRHTCRRYKERRISGLPATQARYEVYMPLIQYPEDTAYTGWLSPRAK